MINEQTMDGEDMHGFNLLVTQESDDLPQRKLDAERATKALIEVTEQRQDRCWLCDRTPVTWVHRVAFDRGSADQPLQEKTSVDSNHYPGAVPGFCALHLGDGPRQLAQVVYEDSDIIFWGYRPLRWFVFFTDGMVVRDSCIVINETPEVMPRTIDKHLQGVSI